MTLASLERRLDDIERRQGMHGALERMTDAQLWRVIRRGYPELARQHGSLPAASRHLRATADPSDAALADLIDENTGGADAVTH